MDWALGGPSCLVLVESSVLYRKVTRPILFVTCGNSCVFILVLSSFYEQQLETTSQLSALRISRRHWVDSVPASKSHGLLVGALKRLAQDKYPNRMTREKFNIVRREFKHGKVAYNFQWNKTNHERIGKDTGDSACLWAHLTTIAQGKISVEPFTNPFYIKASSLRFKKMSSPAKINLQRKLERSGALRLDAFNEIVTLIRELHRNRNDESYRADHGILADFLTIDSKSVAIEVPVWSNPENLSGHIDLVRVDGGVIQVCDYKPGTLESTSRRFFDAIPQIAAYGEMMSHHLASTLRSALDAPLLPQVRCCIFDTHSSWHFGAEMYITLNASGLLAKL